MSQVVISEFMDERAVALLAQRNDVLYEASLVDAPDRLRRALADAAALIVRNRTQVNAALLEAAPLLRVVGRLGVGLDNIDTATCAARGIEVIPATGANARAVAEYVIMTALLLLRGMAGVTEEVAQGTWPRNRMSGGREIAGKTLGLIGFGSIGMETALLGSALGMRVVAFDPAVAGDDPRWTQGKVMQRDLDTLLAEADVVSLHVPLAPATRNLIDTARLRRMKSGAVLVNSARGGVVDEEALAMALRSGALGGAALDVFAQEPLPAGSPLAGCPRLVLTPHIAGVTVESNARVSMLVADKVAAALAALQEPGT